MLYQQQQKSTSAFIPNIQLATYLLIALGVIFAFLLIIGGIVLAAYVVDLAMSALCEIAQHIASLYASSDDIIKLLILCIVAYCVIKVVRFAYRSLWK